MSAPALISPAPTSLRERIQAFVEDAYPSEFGRVRTRRLDGDPRPESIPPRLLNYLRQLRAHEGRGIKRPSFAVSWEIGGALSRLSGKRWANPVTMAWACAHYGHVADLFFRVHREALRLADLFSLASHLETVCHSSAPPPRNRKQLGLPGIHDELALQDARRWDAAMRSHERDDRIRWSIDLRIYAAFAQAWRAQNNRAVVNGLRIDLSNPVVAACHLIAEKAEFDISFRERSAALLLEDGIAALFRGKRPGDYWQRWESDDADDGDNTFA